MDDEPADACEECGAAVPHGKTCTENFHALLLLESEIPGGPGNVAHFYAVASYGLQHPAAMNYTSETIDNLRSALADVLSGAATIEDTRRRVRAAAGRAGRVTRRGDERVPRWPIERWPIVVTDVLAGGVDRYGENVERWASSIIDMTRGVHA